MLNSLSGVGDAERGGGMEEPPRRLRNGGKDPGSVLEISEKQNQSLYRFCRFLCF